MCLITPRRGSSAGTQLTPLMPRDHPLRPRPHVQPEKLVPGEAGPEGERSESRVVQAAFIMEAGTQRPRTVLRRCPSSPQPSPGPECGGAVPVGLLKPVPPAWLCPASSGALDLGDIRENPEPWPWAWFRAARARLTDQQRQASCPLCSGGGGPASSPSRAGRRDEGLEPTPHGRGFTVVPSALHTTLRISPATLRSN